DGGHLELGSDAASAERAAREGRPFFLSRPRCEPLWPAGGNIGAGLAAEDAIGGEPPGDRPQRIARIAPDGEEEAGSGAAGPDHAATIDEGVDARPGADDAQGAELRHDMLGEAQIADHARQPVARDLARLLQLRRPAAADHRLPAAELLQR